MATWNRGRHILPSVRSVLQQQGPGFELIIVGDGCTDDTAQVVAPFLADHVRWLGLPERGGSQSFANNAGLRVARGDIVAYIGHDDIWAPDHLAAIVAAFRAEPDCGFVVSGAALHGPEGSGVIHITGLIDQGGAAFTHFFPPSSLAHRRCVIEDIGPWRAPARLRLPVDCEFQWRAALAGWPFGWTGRITAHKFTSTHRYLSYLQPSSDEQEAMLERLRHADMPCFLEDCMARARQAGTYMVHHLPDPSRHAPGEHAAVNQRIRGLQMPNLQSLGAGVVIGQDDGHRGFDWYPMERVADRDFRWSGPNPRPSLVLPITAQGMVMIGIEVVNAAPGFFDALHLRLNGAPLAWQCMPGRAGRRWLVMTGRLREDAASVLTFLGRTTIADSFAHNGDRRKLGFAAGEVRLLPDDATEEGNAAYDWTRH